jgi:microcystin-dependent protein
MTTQDLQKGIDITGQTDVTGSEMDQLVDAGRLGEDKGMTIVTTDTALDTPEVPDPNHAYVGITPTWWSRYRWKRNPFDNTGVIKHYYWDDLAVSDATLLKWKDEQAVANAALAAATAAQEDATEALTNAATADTKATNAQTTADGAVTNIDTLGDTVEDHGTRISNLEGAASPFPVGSIIPSVSNTEYSTTENQGWVWALGTSVLKTVFNDLWVALGEPSGVDADHFYLPDLRGRVFVGSGQGVYAGATNRIKGQSGGEETHLLTGRESGIQDHSHDMRITGDAVGGGNPGAGNTSSSATLLTAGAQTVASPVAGNKDAIESHNNMPPYYVVNYLIKC